MARRLFFLAVLFMAAGLRLGAAQAETVKLGGGRIDTEAFTATQIKPEAFFYDFFIDNWAALSVENTQAWTGSYRVRPAPRKSGSQVFDWSAVSTFTQELNELSFTGTVSTWVLTLVSTPTTLVDSPFGKKHLKRFTSHYEWVEQTTTFSFLHHPNRDPLMINRVAAVPGPVAGAGLPVLLVGGAMWQRRRRRPAIG